jgi:hypothetical protein
MPKVEDKIYSILAAERAWPGAAESAAVLAVVSNMWLARETCWLEVEHAAACSRQRFNPNTQLLACLIFREALRDDHVLAPARRPFTDRPGPASTYGTGTSSTS